MSFNRIIVHANYLLYMYIACGWSCVLSTVSAADVCMCYYVSYYNGVVGPAVRLVKWISVNSPLVCPLVLVEWIGVNSPLVCPLVLVEWIGVNSPLVCPLV